MDALEKIEKFMDLDMKIKQIIFNCSPFHNLMATTSDAVEYSDKLYKALNEMEYYINQAISLYPIFYSNKEYINNLFKGYYEQVANNSGNYNKLKQIYLDCIASLSDNIKDIVGSSCVGYLVNYSVPLSNAKTINELLHVMHQALVNNEVIYKNMPLLDQKTNNFKYPINLYGNMSKAGYDIFNSFYDELDVGYTDILSISENKIIMMVRDRGHALTIDIELKDDKYLVKYFIPKLCNIDMVNKLKGVNKVTKNDNYTTGIFEVSKEELSGSIIKLIEGVPMDDDLFIEGGLFYDEMRENRRMR